MADSRSMRTVDAHALARHARRLRAAPAPWLHGEAARRMGERLAIVRRRPERVLDWWAGRGGSEAVLRAAYPRSRIVAVESEAAPPAPWWSPERWKEGWRARETQAEAGLAPAAAQLVWANMMLHAVPDPLAQMQAWQNALAVDGFLMFSTLGPGTLEALSAIHAQAGWPPPFAPFVDMHDLGDMLVEAGFADPVMDQELITLTWPDANALLAELRTLGGNAHPARFGGLRTPRWRERLVEALAATAGGDGRPRLVFELVYGHAFKPPPRVRVAGEARVSAEDLRTMARAGRVPR